MPADLKEIGCAICGTPLRGETSPAGVVPCGGCGRDVVVDHEKAKLASPADPAADTGPLPGAKEPSSASLSNSLLAKGAAPVAIPAKIGPYRIDGRLGQGGMGVVYRGHDESLDRDVAVKVIAPAAASDPAAAERLLREARATAAVSHENVVRIYAAGETEEGLPYLVMELITGRDLREVLDREGPLPWRRALELMEEATAGLAAAAARGLVHRDVKPANLLLCEEPGRRSVLKVADFGLAKARATDASLTATGVIAGTALYVAPEVAREGTGDQRADMYSLGATFFHLLAGKAPFQGKTPAAIIVAHLTEPAPQLARKRPDVPEGLARVIDRLLAKDPGDRYATWDALAADLALVRDGREPLAPPVEQHIVVTRPEALAAPVPALPSRDHLGRFVPTRSRAERDLGLAYILWIPPLGMLGFHRFYVGRFATACLYMLTGGLFGIGWLHDLFFMTRLVDEARPAPAARPEIDVNDAIAGAYILWLFGGWLGLHRFYAGRIWSGILWFFTFGCFGFGWIYDLFAIPSMVREARASGFLTVPSAGVRSSGAAPRASSGTTAARPGRRGRKKSMEKLIPIASILGVVAFVFGHWEIGLAMWIGVVPILSILFSRDEEEPATE
jgi:serine/threonine protein kinase/TM2 domain-containing membrane protein YozV